MIRNLPDVAEYLSTGMKLLNLSLDIVLDILCRQANLVSGCELDDDDKETFLGEHNEATKSSTLNALVLTQQGTELLLKARVAEVSPYLLIAGNPREWNKRWAQHDCDFAEFRTVDAQDLEKVVNTVSSERLSVEFSGWYRRLRTKRNVAMHGVHSKLDVNPREVLDFNLDSYAYLIKDRPWIDHRRDYLYSTSAQIEEDFAGVDGGVIYLMDDQMSLLVNVLPREKLRMLCGFDPDVDRYLCQNCRFETSDCWVERGFAQLRTDKHSLLHCPVCGKDEAVFPGKCTNSGCDCNLVVKDVFEETEFICLKCNSPGTRE